MASMHPQVAAAREQIRELCRRFHVERLDLVGSAAAGTHEPGRSDFDFLVEFDFSREPRAFDAYFGLKEALEKLLASRVDLVMRSGLKNPYVRASIERQRQPVYGA
jgi:predicted nucleotidyltransferase